MKLGQYMAAETMLTWEKSRRSGVLQACDWVRSDFMMKQETHVKWWSARGLATLSKFLEWVLGGGGAHAYVS